MIKNLFSPRSLTVILLMSGFADGQTPRMFINEFLASNVTTYADIVDFNDFSDWIELYNDEETAVDLSGCYHLKTSAGFQKIQKMLLFK